MFDYPNVNKKNVAIAFAPPWSLKDEIIRRLLKNHDFKPGEYSWIFMCGRLSKAEKGKFNGKMRLNDSDLERYLIEHPEALN
jgi:hypothetical protein